MEYNKEEVDRRERECFSPTMDLDDACRLLEEAGSASDPIFCGGDETDATALRDLRGNVKANTIRIQYFGCTSLRGTGDRSLRGGPTRPIVLCEGTLYDMVLERYGKARGKRAETRAPGTANAERRVKASASKTRIQRTVKTTTTRTFTAAEIREALRLPPNAELVVRVPGGGDWSNTDLDLDDHPLQVTIETLEESDEET